ncbi:hypothetical protein AKG43_10455 [Neisseria sp. 74A18]|nr:hypothetical protein AKG43_10455 [Neisseria sp. 74A18]
MNLMHSMFENDYQINQIFYLQLNYPNKNIFLGLRTAYTIYHHHKIFLELIYLMQQIKALEIIKETIKSFS